MKVAASFCCTVLRFKRAVNEQNRSFVSHRAGASRWIGCGLTRRQLDELLQWVLGRGAGVTVLEPESFRNRIREEAQRILKRY